MDIGAIEKIFNPHQCLFVDFAGVTSCNDKKKYLSLIYLREGAIDEYRTYSHSFFKIYGSVLNMEELEFYQKAYPIDYSGPANVAIKASCDEERKWHCFDEPMMYPFSDTDDDLRREMRNLIYNQMLLTVEPGAYDLIRQSVAQVTNRDGCHLGFACNYVLTECVTTSTLAANINSQLQSVCLGGH